MLVHLVDGTYELFRHFYGLRRANLPEDPPLGAVAGVLGTVLQMIEQGATHLGVATDHVIESFRNELWQGYKTGEGIEPVLAAQFQPLEDALQAMGVVVWPMVELEADDALASAAHLAALDSSVEKVCIWANDKDLAQCVRGDRVVQVDRRSGNIRNALGVKEKFGVPPELIPDFLALVGDAQAVLFKRLATLRVDAPLFRSVEESRWAGPGRTFDEWTERLGAPRLLQRSRAAPAAAGRR